MPRAVTAWTPITTSRSLVIYAIFNPMQPSERRFCIPACKADGPPSQSSFCTASQQVQTATYQQQLTKQTQQQQASCKAILHACQWLTIRCPQGSLLHALMCWSGCLFRSTTFVIACPFQDSWPHSSILMVLEVLPLPLPKLSTFFTCSQHTTTQSVTPQSQTCNQGRSIKPALLSLQTTA